MGGCQCIQRENKTFEIIRKTDSKDINNKEEPINTINDNINTQSKYKL